jgi:hypothetical protein
MGSPSVSRYQLSLRVCSAQFCSLALPCCYWCFHSWYLSSCASMRILLSWHTSSRHLGLSGRLGRLPMLIFPFWMH